MEGQPFTLTLEYLDACPICQGDDIPQIYRAPWGGNWVTYSQCKTCGQIFLNPRMTDEQTEAFYKGPYRDAVDTADKVDGISPANLKTQEERAKLQVEILGKHFYGCQTNLEIGCSAGYLMNELSKIDILSEGVEPDERYHQLSPARHFPFRSEISKVGAYHFDLITMSHSLEHLNHPLEYMRNLIDNYAHANTKIMVEVPNVDQYPAFGLPHPFAYNLRTLVLLFDRLNFNCAAAYYHGMNGPDLQKYLLAMFERKAE
jgi:hypothetical protein